MSKKDIVTSIALEVGLTKAAAADLYNVVAKSVYQALVEGEKVRFPYIGTLSLKKVAERKYRNPINGEVIVKEEREKFALKCKPVPAGTFQPFPEVVTDAISAEELPTTKAEE